MPIALEIAVTAVALVIAVVGGINLADTVQYNHPRLRNLDTLIPCVFGIVAFFGSAYLMGAVYPPRIMSISGDGLGV